MLHRMVCLVWVALAVVLGAPPLAGGLEAGVGVADLTPDTTALQVQLGGYGERMGAPATGVHDAIMAKAIVFKDGERRFALVSADLLGIPRSLREEVLLRLEGTGIASENFMLSASHSHASIEMAAMNRSNIFGNKAIGTFDEKLLVHAADRIAQAVQAANADFQEIRFGSAALEVPGMNRNRRDDVITDNEMTLFRVDKADGTPWLAYVNYTAHPTFTNEKTMVVSADWPGYLQRTVEAFMAPGVICMYANGAEGDTAPAGASGPSEFARAEDYGQKLAVQAVEAIEGIKTAPVKTFKFELLTLDLPERKAPPALKDSAGPEYGMTEENIEALVKQMVPEDSYLGVFQIDEVMGIAIPGELAAVLGIEIKDALKEAGVKHPYIAGLTNEWVSYMLPAEEYTQGGYEPGVSFYGDTLGPVVVEQAIAAGKGLLTGK
ncbi:MAG: neutral/alkaline non-lysosomal ceramidase N-terminal domain-containing protein [Candidatus Hydrogenedentes bacterium]|nr:neutral/alkaline non-lysosomal ceramidase N-terminal domain-containing protein [Candidatus Hydrogenedentota bacterium]